MNNPRNLEEPPEGYWGDEFEENESMPRSHAMLFCHGDEPTEQEISDAEDSYFNKKGV